MLVCSGFVKAVDPAGTYIKLEEYLTAFGLADWIGGRWLILVAIALSVVECSTGFFLMLGIHKRVASTLALLLLCLMTPLTLYLFIANPVSDCGCFGDAWVLSNGETLAKNVVLLALAAVAYRWRAWTFSLITSKMEWIVSMYTILFVGALSLFCLRYLPIIDFRPYRIGTNIPRAMTLPEGARPGVWESRFLLEKDGEQREFTLDNYPDSTWTYLSTRTVEIQKGDEPAIHDFSLRGLETGEELTDSLLADEGYTFLLIVHRIEEADDSNIDLINEIYDYSVENGYGFYALTSSPAEEVELWCERTGGEYPFCLADDVTLKTMIRSNPGLMLLRGGTILNKWSNASLPDEYELTDRLERLPMGQLKEVDDLHTLGYVLLWFLLPLGFIAAIDALWVRRRERRAVASSANGKTE